MEYDVQLERIQAERPIAVVRRRARPDEYARVVPDACGLVWGVLRGQQVQGAGRHIAIYRGDGQLEVGAEVEAPFAGHGEVVASSIPAGLVAWVVHFGPYQRLGHAHRAVRQWCERRGHALAGPCWEIYDHWSDEWNHDPSKIRTDVYYLLKDDGGGRGGRSSPAARREEGGTEQPIGASRHGDGSTAYREPRHVTLLRNGLIALVVGAAVALPWGGLARWPMATVLAHWPTLGGHGIEVWFLNWLRPRLPNGRGVRVGVRVFVWFGGGIVLAGGMWLTALAFGEIEPATWPAWWVAGIAFVGIELAAHVVLLLRGKPCFYDGRG